MRARAARAPKPKSCATPCGTPSATPSAIALRSWRARPARVAPGDLKILDNFFGNVRGETTTEIQRTHWPPRARVPERVTPIARGSPSARTFASDNAGEKHLLLESFI